MILLPDRYTDFGPPIATAPYPFHEVIIPTEADASFWLWIRPHLLGWHRPINWLPRLVVEARGKTPGHLCGLDSEGNLLVVNTRFDRGARLMDPFAGLLHYSKRNARERAWSAKELHAKWLQYFASENKFIENKIAMLLSTEPITGLYPGVIPYSLDHDAVLRFHSLYGTIAARAILNGGYERAIDRALRLREAAGDPPPVFASLVPSTRDKFELSSEGRKNLRLLQKYADPSRVVLRAMNGARGSKVLRIYCWSPVPAKLN